MKIAVSFPDSAKLPATAEHSSFQNFSFQPISFIHPPLFPALRTSPFPVHAHQPKKQIPGNQ
jgi:hypothetical protein